jgi:hypothetical protein
MTEPESTRRIRAGCGLLAHTPMSDERRAAFDREEERERKAAEFEAEQRRQAALEGRWELERQGVVAHMVADVFRSASFGMDRADAIEARRQREVDELAGKPSKPLPPLDTFPMKKERLLRKVEAPATKGDVAKLSQSVASLASKVGLLGRRRSAKQDYPPQRDYVRNSGRYIVRGPY